MMAHADHETFPAPAPPRKRRLRFGWLDGVLALLFAGGVGYFIWRTSVVLDYRWRWDSLWPFIIKRDPVTGALAPNLLLEGLATTIRLAIYATLIATVIGTAMGLARTSKRLFFRLLSGSYVLLIRNIPPVVFVFVFVFFIASQIMPALGIQERVARAGPATQWWLSLLFGQPKLIENFVVGLVCLSVFSGAYVTEIVRAGLQSVPRAQAEAGDSLGLSRADVMRFVILPQALRNVLPPLANQFIQLIKDSSLVSLVSIQELSFMAQDVQVATQRVFEVFLFVALLYFVLCFGLARVFAYLEVRALRSRR